MTGTPAPVGRPALTRRRVLTGAFAAGAAVLGAGALSGCGSALAAGDSTVRLWDLFQGADGGLLNDMVRRAQPDMPGTHIDRTVLEWGTPYYTKLAMASAGGRGPDVAVAHMSRLAGYAPTGLVDPWDMDLMAEFGIHESDFADAVWQRTQYDGATYAIPLDTHPFIVFFHPEPTKKAGLLTADGTLDLDAFSSPDRFLAAGRELAKASGKQGISFGYVNDTAQGWRLFYGLYRQTGGTFELPPGGPAKADIDRMAEVIAFMAKLVDGKVNPKRLDYNSSVAAFTNRQTAMALSGEWELGTFRTADKKVDAAPFPTVFGTPAIYADSHSFVLPHRDHPDAAHRRRTHQAVAALLKAGQTWATAGHIPAYTPVTRTEAYAELLPQAHYKSAASQVVLDPAVWFAGAGSDFQNAMSQVLQQALLDGLAPVRAARAMVRRVNTFLTKPSPA
ncbi:ABC transporter substrate-binding protein [Streptomyces sp. VRA16 Mangrove soil]|uniref:ABC transporter substrate-binding protein n=1 Tax=Streptomyces sp. VRA16 Mangrove soil TaxID=2817434 RepID=UPI001A9F14ED|nr:extracellular solute-binding protein [Streptomyces sp. VRA16 Mangrove soil]MBO1334534.1 extracellular solute-binding protein [Streptomyces sp. VRA16 Mangrove soil]